MKEYLENKIIELNDQFNFCVKNGEYESATRIIAQKIVLQDALLFLIHSNNITS